LDALLSRFVDRTRILDRAVEQARRLFDFILFDTAPSAADITTVAAYSTAEWFLLSAFPHPLSLGGLTEALNDIADVRRYPQRRSFYRGLAPSPIKLTQKRFPAFRS